MNPATGQPYRLPTKTVTTAETVDGTIDSTLDTTFTSYEPVVTGDTSGWDLGQAITNTADMDGSGTITAGDITSRSRYDNRGRIIEIRQPKSSGSDAGTRVTTYYTAGTSPVTGCGSKPEWAGQVCQVGPAAQPSGQTMPVTKTTGYTWDLQPTTEVATSGAVTSTSTTTYNAQDRPITSSTTVTGLTGSTPVPAVTTTYDTATGEVTGTSSTAGTTAMTYDSWGRQLTYTNTPAGQTGDSSTTTYDPASRVISVIDNNGQTAYTYDGTDAAGKAERRGQVTTVKVKVTGGTEYTSTGAYDEGGDLTLEKLPGNINRRTSLDIAGEQTDYTYSGQVTDPDTGTITPDQPWLGWSTWSDSQSKITREWTPDAAAYNGELPGTDAIASDRTYNYDPADRLTRVDDTTGNPDVTNPVPCTTRTYTFDTNGNRINQNTYPAASDGSCTTSTTGTPTARTYDAADRLTTGANNTGTYTYDQLGRQTLIPAVDAPNATAGNITLAYYDTDSIRTITQNGTTTSQTLDGAARRLMQTETASGSTTSTLVRHYVDSSDNPTWTTDTTGNTTTTTRYSELVDGNLGFSVTTTGDTSTAELALTTPRGDVAATVIIPTSIYSATGIDVWANYGEYGLAANPATRTSGGVSGVGYGWLGAKQRSTTTAGLLLMGARLYNPRTGTFTTTDPVPNGGATSYGYPHDPINNTDVNGQWWRRAWGAAKRYVSSGYRYGRRAYNYASGYVRRAYQSVRAGTNPYLRIGNGRISWGNTRSKWRKTSGWRRQVTRFHGHIGRSGKGYYYGVNVHFKNRSYSSGIRYQRGQGVTAHIRWEY